MKLEDTNYSTEQIKEISEKYIMNTFQRYDFVQESGKGMYVTDTDGNEYLDFYAGIAVNSTGNQNEKVIEAIIEQTKDLIHSSNYPYSIPQALLAEKICNTIGMEKIFFQNSGTEANEAMIKLARKYGIDNYGPDRYKIVTAKKSFHGRTLGSMAATGQPESAIQKGFGDMIYGFTYADYNDLESFKNAVDENTIAIMVEPIQGEGGLYPATYEFLKGLRELCDEKEMLLLYDEVQTGWGRTGSFMAYMEYGVKPDIVSMAKAMGAGLPIGAICSTKKVADSFTPGSHGSTFCGNPVACAASLAQLNIILDEKLCENAKKVGTYFMEKLKDIPYVKEVRGKGLMIGVEFESSVSAAEIKHNCIENKFLVTALGNNTIRMLPALTATEAHCDEAYNRLKKSVEQAAV